MDQRVNSADTSLALSKRYGDNAIPPIGPWNDTIALLLSHRSIRSYRSDPLPQGTLETLAAAAQSAATSSNMQMWSMIAVTDADTKAKIAAAAQKQKHIEQCPLFLVFVADCARNRRLGDAAGTDLASLDYLESFLVASIDAALAAQNAVIAAESLGLSTVYIGALRNQPETIAALLGLPPGTLGVFGLCVGYADVKAVNEVKPRLPQNAVLFHGRYGVTGEADLIADYDQEMGAFSKRHEMSDDTWSGRVLNRLSDPANLNGRDKLASILNRMGFKLK